MAAPTPEPGPEEEQPPGGAPGPQACDGWGGPGWAWAPGSAGAGPVPRCERPGPQPDLPSADGLPAGPGYPAPGGALAAARPPGTHPRGPDRRPACLAAARGGGAAGPR